MPRCRYEEFYPLAKVFLEVRQKFWTVFKTRAIPCCEIDVTAGLFRIHKIALSLLQGRNFSSDCGADLGPKTLGSGCSLLIHGIAWGEVDSFLKCVL